MMATTLSPLGPRLAPPMSCLEVGTAADRIHVARFIANGARLSDLVRVGHRDQLREVGEVRHGWEWAIDKAFGSEGLALVDIEERHPSVTEAWACTLR